MSHVRQRLEELGLAAHRSRGQNFLVDPAVAARIAGSSGIEPGECVLEIGTGLGILTRALAARARRVVTVEVDAGLVRALEGQLPESVELVHADVLELDLGRFGATRVVANLPYSISSPVLRRLLDLRDSLRAWVVLLQRELAARLTARPGTRDYGSLSVLHQIVASVEKRFDLPPSCFHPRPRVTSSLMSVIPLTPSPLGADELGWLEKVVRAAFGQRRKTLVNALRSGLGVSAEGLIAALEDAGVDPRARAEVVAPEELLGLARRLRELEE